MGKGGMMKGGMKGGMKAAMMKGGFGGGFDFSGMGGFDFSGGGGFDFSGGGGFGEEFDFSAKGGCWGPAAVKGGWGGGCGFEGKGGCVGGKGKGGKGKAKQQPELDENGVPLPATWADLKKMGPSDWCHVEGFDEALVSVLQPIADEETVWGPEEMLKKVKDKMLKPIDKYKKDDRILAKCSNSLAKALMDEFIESVMYSVQGGLEEKTWFTKVDWKVPLLVLTLEVFKNPKVLCRVLVSSIPEMVQDGLFKWQEEERVQKVMWETIEASGCNATHQKKAHTHLKSAFDEAYPKAPYGSTQAATAEEALLQDFVKGWIRLFIAKAYDVLEHGLQTGAREEQIIYVTGLFQNLMTQESACVPSSISTQLQAMPPAPWQFVASCVEEYYIEQEMAAEGAAAKKRKMAMGIGW